MRSPGHPPQTSPLTRNAAPARPTTSLARARSKMSALPIPLQQPRAAARPAGRRLRCVTAASAAVGRVPDMDKRNFMVRTRACAHSRATRRRARSPPPADAPLCALAARTCCWWAPSACPACRWWAGSPTSLCRPSTWPSVPGRPRPAAARGSRVARAAGGGGGQVAKDALGDAVTQKKWLATHLPGDRQLTQGLKARAVAAARRVGWRQPGRGCCLLLVRPTADPAAPPRRACCVRATDLVRRRATPRT